MLNVIDMAKHCSSYLDSKKKKTPYRDAPFGRRFWRNITGQCESYKFLTKRIIPGGKSMTQTNILSLKKKKKKTIYMFTLAIIFCRTQNFAFSS